MKRVIISMLDYTNRRGQEGSLSKTLTNINEIEELLLPAVPTEHSFGDPENYDSFVHQKDSMVDHLMSMSNKRGAYLQLERIDALRFRLLCQA